MNDIVSTVNDAGISSNSKKRVVVKRSLKLHLPHTADLRLIYREQKVVDWPWQRGAIYQQ